MSGYFNPRPPRGGRRVPRSGPGRQWPISIHAPREGGRLHVCNKSVNQKRFQSTPPARGATEISAATSSGTLFQSTPPARGATTYEDHTGNGAPDISIHAPREGGDFPAESPVQPGIYFNPRPPRGGRPSWPCVDLCIPLFQSTPPARGATDLSYITQPYMGNFNPRPPRGGRLVYSCSRNFSTVFQSTPPARGATFLSLALGFPVGFQSTPPARGATWPVFGCSFLMLDFNPRPPRGGRPPSPRVRAHHINFNPRPPRGGRQQRCTVLPVDL